MNNLTDEKILVCYLLTKFDNEESLLNFIKNYTKYESGLHHKLLICFKLIDAKTINVFSKHLSNISFIEFIDNHDLNDFDFGSYKRVAEKFPEMDILFLNSHSYPACNNWLQKLMLHKNDDNLIGTTGSFESLADSIKLKKFYKFISFFLRKIKYKNDFNSFPNPHLRTSSFLVKGKLFYNFIKNKKINNKYDTWKIESGKYSLTNYFKKKGVDIFVINSDGKKFTENQWLLSETFNYLDQSKCIISDKHTRKYLKFNNSDKKKAQYKTWGKQ